MPVNLPLQPQKTSSTPPLPHPCATAGPPPHRPAHPPGPFSNPPIPPSGIDDGMCMFVDCTVKVWDSDSTGGCNTPTKANKMCGKPGEKRFCGAACRVVWAQVMLQSVKIAPREWLMNRDRLRRMSNWLSETNIVLKYPAIDQPPSIGWLSWRGVNPIGQENAAWYRSDIICEVVVCQSHRVGSVE